jgi:hypothetical protein
MEKIRYIKDFRVVREQTDTGLMTVMASGIAQLKNLISPLLINSKEYQKPSADGIYELDFVLGNTGEKPVDVEFEVDVVFKFKKLPDWVKGIKINAAENSDIELI